MNHPASRAPHALKRTKRPPQPSRPGRFLLRQAFAAGRKHPLSAISTGNTSSAAVVERRPREAPGTRIQVLRPRAHFTVSGDYTDDTRLEKGLAGQSTSITLVSALKSPERRLSSLSARSVYVSRPIASVTASPTRALR